MILLTVRAFSLNGVSSSWCDFFLSGYNYHLVPRLFLVALHLLHWLKRTIALLRHFSLQGRLLVCCWALAVLGLWPCVTLSAPCRGSASNFFLWVCSPLLCGWKICVQAQHFPPVLLQFSSLLPALSSRICVQAQHLSLVFCVFPTSRRISLVVLCVQTQRLQSRYGEHCLDNL